MTSNIKVQSDIWMIRYWTKKLNIGYLKSGILSPILTSTYKQEALSKENSINTLARLEHVDNIGCECRYFQKFFWE
jgi:hypothetical protein